VLDHADLDHAAVFIARHKALRGAELARVVGDYVLAAFFDGDFAEFCRKSRSKPVKFRSLVARRELGFSAGRLCLLVRISQQLRELPQELGDALSLSHHRALLPLREPGLKRRLADAARRHRWSSHRLEEEVRGHLASCRAGRKPVGVLVRSLGQLNQSIREVQRAAAIPGELSRLHTGDLNALRESAQLCRDALAELATTLGEPED
jgi:hypothetical protein